MTAVTHFDAGQSCALKTCYLTIYLYSIIANVYIIKFQNIEKKHLNLE